MDILNLNCDINFYANWTPFRNLGDFFLDASSRKHANKVEVEGTMLLNAPVR